MSDVRIVKPVSLMPILGIDSKLDANPPYIALSVPNSRMVETVYFNGNVPAEIIPSSSKVLWALVPDGVRGKVITSIVARAVPGWRVENASLEVSVDKYNQICTQRERLVQRFTLEFLTERGSDITDRARGTDCRLLIGSAQGYTEDEARRSVVQCVRQAEENLKRVQNDTLLPAEVLLDRASVTAVEVVKSTGTVAAVVRLRSQAGGEITAGVFV